MVSVTGITSEALKAMFAQTIGSLALDSAGQLTYTKKDGTVVNAGSMGNSIVSLVINGAGHLIATTRQGTVSDLGSVASSPLDSWPIGSIHFSTTLTTAAAVAAALGGGTWVAWGSGRVPIGVDNTQTEFDTVEETGGSKSSSIAAHTHTISHTHEHPHYHPLSITNIAAGGGSVSHPSSPNTQQPNDATTGAASTPNSGSAGAATVSNLQPYITVYMYKRTA